MATYCPQSLVERNFDGVLDRSTRWKRSQSRGRSQLNAQMRRLGVTVLTLSLEHRVDVVEVLYLVDIRTTSLSGKALQVSPTEGLHAFFGWQAIQSDQRSKPPLGNAGDRRGSIPRALGVSDIDPDGYKALPSCSRLMRTQ